MRSGALNFLLPVVLFAVALAVLGPGSRSGDEAREWRKLAERANEVSADWEKAFVSMKAVAIEAIRQRDEAWDECANKGPKL